MRIAIARDGQQVSEHFGHCQDFVIYELEDNKIINQYTLDNPDEHEPGYLPDFLQSHDVNLIITGGIGGRAKQLFNQKGIQTISGVTGSVSQILDDYLAGKLVGTDETCQGDQQ